MTSRVFSGEPLPLAPNIKDPEMSAFIRKLLDYLRRLAGKLTSVVENGGGGGGGGGALATYAGYFVGNQSLGPSYASVVWNHDLRKDSVYSHDITTENDRVEVLVDGFYLVHLDLEFSPSATFPATASLMLLHGSSAATINFAFGTIGAGGTLSRSIGLPLVAGVKLLTQVKDSSGSPGNNILAEGSRFTIVKLANDSGGGSGAPPGDGWTGVGENGIPGWSTSVAMP